jgi:hypothetical protein
MDKSLQAEQGFVIRSDPFPSHSPTFLCKAQRSVLAMASADPSPVLLKDATLEQVVQAISAKIGEQGLNYTEEEVL